MSKKVVLKSVLDGIIQGVGLALLTSYIVSVYAQDQSVTQYMVIGVLGGVLSAVVYFLFLIRESSNKVVIIFTISSTICCILTVAVVFLIQFIPGDLFPRRELTNADGIAILLANGSYAFLSVFLKFIFFLTFIIKNIGRSITQKACSTNHSIGTENGSVASSQR